MSVVGRAKCCAVWCKWCVDRVTTARAALVGDRAGPARGYGPGAPASALSPSGGPCPVNSGIGIVGNTMTFSSLFGTVLQVTDAFISGENFRVVIDGQTFFTPAATPFAVVNVFDPNEAFANPGYSHGSWSLTPGAHSVDIFAVNTATPSSGGAAYVRVLTSTVPEASTYAYMLAGLLTLGVGARRRRKVGSPLPIWSETIPLA